MQCIHANVKLSRWAWKKCCAVDGGMPSKWVGFLWLPQYYNLGLIGAGITQFASGWSMYMRMIPSFPRLSSKDWQKWTIREPSNYKVISHFSSTKLFSLLLTPWQSLGQSNTMDQIMAQIEYVAFKHIMFVMCGIPSKSTVNLHI